MKINIVDAPMGTGKTEAAIHFMNTASDDIKFIYVTPNNTETERIKNKCKKKAFCVPDNNNASGTKTQSLEELVFNKRNVAITHALFVDYLTDRTLTYIVENNYTLILDEVVEVVKQEKIKKDEINELDGIGKDGNFNEQYKLIEQDENGIVRWVGKKNYEGNAKKWKEKIDTGNIQRINNNMFFWVTPIMKFSAFKEVYVLTYLFDSSGLKYYYDMWKPEYNDIYIENNNGDYSFTNKKVTYDFKMIAKSLVFILDGECNDIGEDYFALSKGWFDDKKNRNLINALGNITYNIFYNKLNLKANDVIWTVFSDYSGTYDKKDKPWKKRMRREKSIGIKSYNNGFLASNCKAVNEYGDRHFVAYLINKFMYYPLKLYFENKGTEPNEDEYAYSELLQFIWRSAVRNREPILLFIPSKRMREMLINRLGLDESKNIIQYKSLDKNYIDVIENRSKHYYEDVHHTETDEAEYNYDNTYIPPDITKMSVEEYQKQWEEHNNRGRMIIDTL